MLFCAFRYHVVVDSFVVLLEELEEDELEDVDHDELDDVVV